MNVKCYFQDSGYCKFGTNCNLLHPEVICRERNCRSKSCPKRHPKPCRNFFIRRYCRFGQSCKYDHIFDCEICDNLKYLVAKEIERAENAIEEKDDIIEKMRKERSNNKKEMLRIIAEITKGC